MAAFDIFTHSIRYLKQQAEHLMREQGIDVGKENISWVITVPAIWTDSAKQFMREAAEKVKCDGIYSKMFPFITCSMKK